MERSSPQRLGHVRVVLLDLDGVLSVVGKPAAGFFDEVLDSIADVPALFGA